jgi:hypothetical protein
MHKSGKPFAQFGGFAEIFLIGGSAGPSNGARAARIATLVATERRLAR